MVKTIRIGLLGAGTVGDAVAKAAKVKPTALWDDAWARFAGLYRSPYDDSIVQVVRLNKQLVLLPAGVGPAETKVMLEPLGEGRFKLMAPTGGGRVGEVVRFEEKEGNVTRMVTGDGWSDRVESY